MTNSEQEYMEQVAICRDVFAKKNKDYGTSWRVLRPIAIVDQLYIKAQRIRTLQEKKEQRISDSILDEWRAIVNYGIIALIQEELKDNEEWDIPSDMALALFEKHLKESFDLMNNKNHDYGEAWRNMSQESFADLIMTKILRIKQIIQNNGKTIISEGIDANYRDIINYAVFALINQK
ncbi:MAG: DUF1599 domain-containing protein [Chitinophagaceae bacterium]